jgi:hypothetical protein
MTIKELIEKLKTYPPELEIQIEGWDGYASISEHDFYVMNCENPQTDILMIDLTNIKP